MYIHNIVQSFGLFLCPIALYIGCTLFYRLYLSPLAKFPGTILAAATGWYEAYFDVVKGGQYMWEIQRMHQNYGPIIRISPSEIHIQDAAFYETLYGGTAHKRDKDAWFVNIGLPQCCFSTAPYNLHRMRRNTLLPFFKHQEIKKFEPIITFKVEEVCQHLTNLIKTKEAVDLHALFMCFAADTLSTFIFGSCHCFNYLQRSSVTDTWKKKPNSVFELLLLVRNLPWLLPLARAMPTIASWVNSKYSNVDEAEKVSLFFQCNDTSVC